MFKVGQKVICVDPNGELNKGQIYTIKASFFSEDAFRIPMVSVQKVKDFGANSYYARRFKPAPSAKQRKLPDWW